MALELSDIAQEQSDTGPFSAHPGFYQRDNRQHRGLNPITRGTLEAKCSVLIPEWLVRGKTILDLGSCLGAFGQWALHFGAASYTGVELQAEYCAESRKLLSHWGDRAQIKQEDLLTFVSSTKDRSYDIVVAAGILYLFLEPKQIIDAMCRIASESVVVELNQPMMVERAEASVRAMFTEYRLDQNVNLANGNHSMQGIAACPSRPALDLLFALNSFVKREETLGFPPSPETAIYTDTSINKSGLPRRYATRYFRAHDITVARDLQQNLPNRRGPLESWEHSPRYVRGTAKLRQAAERVAQSHRPWQFDSEVARQFDDIAATSIPHYREVIQKCIQVINKCAFNDPKIIDVGSATGNTLRRLHEAGYRNLYGVDSSQDMLARSFDQATLIHSSDFPVEQGPFQVIIANWVLHFIPERERYLRSMTEALAADGVLILSDKVASSAMTHELYHDFKRANGLSEEEIAEKHRRLIGVLTPYPLEWYLTTLRELGFLSVDVVDAAYSFVTLIARR